MKKISLLIIAVSAIATVDAAEPIAKRPSLERMAHACSGCHGTYGHAIAPTPVLAGISEEGFVKAMREFKAGQRESSIMNRISQAYSDEEIVGMAQFFKKQ